MSQQQEPKMTPIISSRSSEEGENQNSGTCIYKINWVMKMSMSNEEKERIFFYLRRIKHVSLPIKKKYDGNKIQLRFQVIF